MRAFSIILLILIIILGIWYFAFYNDRYEAADDDNNPAGIVEENDDRFAITIEQELDADDDGGIFYYLPETEFSIFLPESANTPELECSPAGAIITLSDEPDAPEGQEAFSFETVEEGSCRIEIGSFEATVNVINPSKD